MRLNIALPHHVQAAVFAARAQHGQIAAFVENEHSIARHRTLWLQLKATHLGSLLFPQTGAPTMNLWAAFIFDKSLAIRPRSNACSWPPSAEDRPCPLPRRCRAISGHRDGSHWRCGVRCAAADDSQMPAGAHSLAAGVRAWSARENESMAVSGSPGWRYAYVETA